MLPEATRFRSLGPLDRQGGCLHGYSPECSLGSCQPIETMMYAGGRNACIVSYMWMTETARCGSSIVDLAN